MLNRRHFLKTVGAGMAAANVPVKVLASRTQESTGYFGLHQFIEDHPEAVFIMKTNAADKYDTDAKLAAGLSFGRSVFVPKDESSGMPLTTTIPVKGNLKTANPDSYDHDLIMSHTIDAIFTEGVFEGLKELGIQGSQIHLREVNRPDIYKREPYGFEAMCNRTGTDLRLDMAPKVTSLTEGADYNWIDVPDGVFYSKIPYLEPINTPDSWLLNISKFKAHGMGLTLCCKNLQGSIVHNYQAFCTAYNRTMDMLSSHRQPDAKQHIQTIFQEHLEAGVPRWDRPGSDFNSGIGMETWVQRTLDNLSVTPAGLHIIEGIYGRDGQGNNDRGPNPQDVDHNCNDYGVSETGKAWDWMSNVIIFGRDSFRVDIIGFWLGGHEPGNVGLFHSAISRGMLDVIDPSKIPVYIWEDGTATQVSLDSLERTNLLTYYLRRNYLPGEDEPAYHLLDEPFNYGTVTGVNEPDLPAKPQAFVLSQNHPNPFNPSTAIEYALPEGGNVLLEVFNSAGQRVSVLANGYRGAGSHMATWNTSGQASGVYFYRLRFGGFSETRKMTLMR